MAVYQQILEWSKTRPAWQRDALRRLVHRDELGRDEIVELADMCVAEFVDKAEVDFSPLTVDDLPTRGSGGGEVSLRGLRDLEGVALLEKDLEFAPSGLTLISGPNGSGKSGYARLLKKFCRARKADEPIRSNVFEGARASRATLVYAVDGNEYRSTWTEGAAPPEQLAAVSVFDSASVDAYVGSKLDVAYRPDGLDLLPRLSDHSDAVRDELTRRQTEIERNLPKLPEVMPGTKAAEFLAGLTAKTKAVDIEAACTFGADKAARKQEVIKQATALEGPERAQQANSLRQRADRLGAVAKHLDQVAAALSADAGTALQELDQQVRALKAASEFSAATQFASYPVQPVGTALWKAMFDSATSFFAREVSPEGSFPGERCVLCHQELSDAARERLDSFVEHVQRTTEAEAKQAQDRLRNAMRAIEGVQPSNPLVESVIAEIRDEASALAGSIEAFVSAATARRQAMLAFDEGASLPDSVAGALRSRSAELAEQAAKLQTAPDDELLDQLNAERDELRAAERLAENADAVRAHHRALQRLAKFDKAITSAKTNQITKQNGILTREAVTDALEAAFAREARSLQLPLTVTLQKGGTRKGEQLHVLQLEGAPDKTTPAAVASSGEAQLVALANFFTELATAPAKSAVVFDDPVNHLDERNIEVVARKLADAAGERQTVVFTHDERLGQKLEQIAADWAVPIRRVSLS